MKSGDIVDRPVQVKVSRIPVDPGIFASQCHFAGVVSVHRTLESVHAAENIVVGKPRLPGVEADNEVIREIENTGEVIPTVTGERPSSATGPIGLERLSIRHPTGDIERMDVLFGNNISGERSVDRPSAK